MVKISNAIQVEFGNDSHHIIQLMEEVHKILLMNLI